MNFECLNKMIKYIENNLENKIDFNKLSQIANTNLFILERIFVFLTDMTITEYIKKRKLSKAFEEIRNTNQKIIDIAYKYQYNSPTSFNRAFKKLFNITPMECRKGVGNYKIIPILYFESNNEKINFDYRIKELNVKPLYCYHITAESEQNLIYNIRELYQKVKETQRYEEFNKTGMYGIFKQEDNLYHYYLGSTKYYSDLEKFEIKNNKYAEFKLTSREQNKIVNLEKQIIKQWVPSTNYDIKMNMKIECYEEDNCMIYLPLT